MSRGENGKMGANKQQQQKGEEVGTREPSGRGVCKVQWNSEVKVPAGSVKRTHLHGYKW